MAVEGGQAISSDQSVRPWPEDMAAVLSAARAAQQVWSATRIRARLAILRRARHSIAASAVEVAQTVPCEQPGALHRTVADTLVSEVLPLVEACRFLEREAVWILASERLSAHTRPFWLRRVTAETFHEPLGVVLIIAPANYPLFLPGTQALQALAAGNAVLWKPAPGGAAAAESLRAALIASGLDPALLQVLDQSPRAASDAIQEGVAKVFLTGSAATGAAVLSQLAQHLTPAAMELSGCDAVFVLPGADVDRAVDAIIFGLRLNGSATCMAPRRLFVVGEQASFMPLLLDRVRQLDSVPMPEGTQARVPHLMEDLLADARRLGGNVILAGTPANPQYAIVTRAKPEMLIARSDIFAPVLAVFDMPSVDAAVTVHAHCPYALTAAVFGPEHEARALSARLPVGTVLINDVIVAAADPRIAFSGRRSSGFGVTRGREGLLEMTALKTVLVQRSRDRRAYRPTTPDHQSFFAAYIATVHSGSWRARWQGLQKFLRVAARLK